MSRHISRLSAIFPRRASAQAAYAVMRAAGFAEEQLVRVDAERARPVTTAASRHRTASDVELPDTLVVGGAGDWQDGQGESPGVGGVTVYMSEAVLTALTDAMAPTVNKGGGGMARTLPLSEADFLTTARDARRHGFWTLVAHARDEEQATAAQLVMSTLVSENFER